MLNWRKRLVLLMWGVFGQEARVVPQLEQMMTFYSVQYLVGTCETLAAWQRRRMEDRTV